MKTVIFDLGNVLINVDFRKMYNKISHLISYSFDESMLLLKKIMIDYNRGELTSLLFYQKVVKILKLDISFAGFCDIWIDIFEKNELIYDFAEKLDRDKFRIIIASNTDPLHYQYIKEKYKLDFVENEFLSYREKEVKPEMSFFYKLIDKCGIDLDESVFIDDLLENVNAARNAGLTVYQNVDNQKTITMLESFLL